MKNIHITIKQFSLLLTYALLFTVLFSCGNSDSTTDKKADTASEERRAKQLKVVCTTSMIKDAVLNVAGDKVAVEALMGSGVDPHLYKPTPGDIKKLQEADVIFYHGLYLEAKLEEVLEKMKRNKKVVAVSDGIDQAKLIETGSSKKGKKEYDPHIWFDVTNWMTVVGNVSNALIAADAANTTIYKDNAKKHINDLVQVHEGVQRLITAIPEQQRLLITSHDAFGYFGKAYGIQVEALQGISTVADFGVKDVSRLVDLITSRKVKSVFIESSVPRKPLEAVIEGCKKRKHEVSIGGTLFSDAMGKEGTIEGTYIGMVKHNVKLISKGLK